MEKTITVDSAAPAVAAAALAQTQTRFKVLGALSFSHFLNDMMQSLIVSIYPLLKGEFHLSFVQIGVITLTYQMCASILQPLIGLYTDKHPKPYSLSVGMGFTLVGIVTLAFAPNYASVLGAAALIGAGSSIFHPESSRIARLASGGRHGLAQSIFQVGRQCRQRHGSAARRLDHHSARANEPGVVCHRRAARHRRAGAMSAPGTNASISARGGCQEPPPRLPFCCPCARSRGRSASWWC